MPCLSKPYRDAPPDSRCRNTSRTPGIRVEPQPGHHAGWFLFRIRTPDPAGRDPSPLESEFSPDPLELASRHLCLAAENSCRSPRIPEEDRRRKSGTPAFLLETQPLFFPPVKKLPQLMS